ncbi:MAG: hypothetical protein AB4426_03785 [Xenococcaceae cyanobacterium]
MTEERLQQIEATLENHSQRLDRIEEIVEHNSQQISQNSQQLQILTERVDRLTTHMVELTDMFTQSMAVIREVQNQVKGIQTENQRILDHLFGGEQQ